MFLSACGGGGEDDGVQINATTDRQQELAGETPAVPTLVLPSTPEQWGDNLAPQRVVSPSGGPWMAFAPDEYDHDADQAPTLAGLWVLHEPVGDKRNDAVFVTLTMVPHGYESLESKGNDYGDDLESAVAALRVDAGIAESDVSQSEATEVSGDQAWLLTGFGETGSNEGFNFAYTVVDDGEFFYTYRLAGDPDYFSDFQDDFLNVVTYTEFKE